jgi:cytochrome c553
MKKLFALLLTTLAASRVFAAPAAAPAAAAPQLTKLQTDFFENRIRPVLVNQCYRCHSAADGKTKGGLALDSREGLFKGGDSGPAVVPGNPDKSPLIKAVRYTDANLQMPPKGEKLPDSTIADLVSWVRMGAPDPRTGKAKYGTAAAARAQHWAWQPVKKLTPPKVSQEDWIANPIDAFVLAKLEEKNMKPSAPADRRTLIRRATFDLIGLPPSPEEVKAFVEDTSKDAYEKLIDRLLKSPHYGERWGRYWLDVARYSDTKGEAARRRETPVFPYAWTYRDYVIRAFNEDKPFHQFIVEQIAADKIPNNKDRTSLAALGFLTVGDHFNGNANDVINDRIDVVTKAFQALTVSCARCHDHMFDPIPQRDYYSLHGIFASCMEPRELPIIDGPIDKTAAKEYWAKRTELQTKLEGGGGAKGKDKKAQDRNKLELQASIEALDVNHPGAPGRAMILEDKEKPADSPIFLRGEAQNKGDIVPRRYLEVVSGPVRKPFYFGSGRLELAYAIANRANPLTPRVIMNRLWLHHFGEGIVTTPDDFGTQSAPPSHPELLDWLSMTFMDSSWSLKRMHKIIMLSNTYQQSSANNPRFAQIDPFNRLLWRANIRRLEFEPLRDSILAMGGELDRTVGGRAVNLAGEPGAGRTRGLGKAAGELRPHGAYSTRRTVYGYIDRANLAEMFNHFDFASPEMPTGKRYETIVPQQALFLMNSPLVIEQARNVVERRDFQAIADPEDRIAFLYGLIFQREPTPIEFKLGLGFFDDAPLGASSSGEIPLPEKSAAKVAAGGGKTPAGKSPNSTAARIAMLKPLNTWAEFAHALLLTNEASYVN